MYKIKLLIICFFLSSYCYAQQLPLFTQYRENLNLLNPAASPTDFMVQAYSPTYSMGISYRHQWAQLEDAPRTMTARYDQLLKNFNMLVGATLFKDETGPTGLTGGYLRYAYRAHFNSNTYLSIGVAAGLMQYRFRGDQGILRDPGDVLGMSNNSTLVADVNLGVFFQSTFHNGDAFYAGSSIPQLLSTQLTTPELENFSTFRQQHFYAVLGYYKYLGKRSNDMFLEPSMWLRYVPNAPVEIDMNLRFQMSSLFWIGSGYSVSLGENFHGNNFHLEAGFILGELMGFDDKNLKIGYGFDRSVTVYGPKFGSSHEMNLTYSFK